MTDYSGTDNLEIMSEAVNYNRFLKELVLQHATHGDRILDFGAGIGTFASRVVQEGFDVSCLEVDEAQARTIVQQGLELVTSLADIGDEAYDYVYTLNVLEHIEDDAQALRDLFRVVKPGGKVLVYVPAMQILFSSMDRKVGHFRRYTKSSLVQVATGAGFTVAKCRYADSLGFPATLIYKWFGRDNGELSKAPLILYDRIAFPLSRLLDVLCGFLLGKNVYAVLVKQAGH